MPSSQHATAEALKGDVGGAFSQSILDEEGSPLEACAIFCPADLSFPAW